MKLELKHLAPYLPYSLKGKEYDSSKVTYELTTITETFHKNNLFIWNVCGESLHPSRIDVIPILRPLSDFYEEIDGLSLSDMTTHGYHNDFWYEDNFDVKHLNYYDFTRLAEKHCDLFGLIEKGLAIDINTL